MSKATMKVVEVDGVEELEKETETTQGKKLTFNMDDHDVLELNNYADFLSNILSTHDYNIKMLGQSTEALELEQKFFKEAKEHFPNKNWGDGYIAKGLEVVGKKLEQNLKSIESETLNREEAQKPLDLLRSKIDIQETETSIHFEYDKQFFEAILFVLRTTRINEAFNKKNEVN